MPHHMDGAKKKAADDDEDKGSTRGLMIGIIVMIALLLLATVDSFTTHYFKRMCNALALWTMENAPWSFVAYEFIILIFLVFCLPYGPLGVLSGALFYQKYGKNGLIIAGLALFTFTLAGACICFALARYRFKDTVQKIVNKNPKLKFLKSLDRLIEAGQGIEMVVLIRLAPLPKGPTNYFLGTTCVSWKDFVIGSCIVNLPMSFVDVCIGAGASNVKKDSPLSIAVFVVVVACFLGLICYVGGRAKRKLSALEDEDATAEANDELSVLHGGDGDNDNDDGEGGAGGKKGGKAVKGGAPTDSITDSSEDEAESGLLHEQLTEEKKKTETGLQQGGSMGQEQPHTRALPERGSSDSALKLLGKLDALQLVGKPNGWTFPDAKLEMRRATLKQRPTEQAGTTVPLDGAQLSPSGRSYGGDCEPSDFGDSATCRFVVDSVVVQLTSQSLSFQLVSQRVGWGLRIYPKHAAPKFGVHASKEGLLAAGDPGRVACAVADGGGKGAGSKQGHGHNFHVVESVGDSVRVHVRRTLQTHALSNQTMTSTGRQTLTEVQLSSRVGYEVWYTLEKRGTCKDHAKASALAAEQEEDRARAEAVLAHHAAVEAAAESEGSGGGSATKRRSTVKPKLPPKRKTSLSKRVKVSIEDFELDPAANFRGGDGVDLGRRGSA